jgi:transketolase
MTITDPCDALDMEQAVEAIADYKGPVYMRLLRGKVASVLHEIEDYKFELGSAALLRDGNKATICCLYPPDS